MISQEQMTKIKTLADEVSRREGCRLYDVEIGGGRERILRVYVENEKENVSIEQLANVSRGLSLLLDVQDVVPGAAYELEVSSPGVDRILREKWHFQGAIGRSAKLILFDRAPELKGEVKSLQSVIKSASETHVGMEHNGTPVEIPYENIKRAQVVFEYKTNEKKR
jgi:ribosome maturation factor RimP